MAVTYTNLLGFSKPVTGTESGTWGDIVNDQVTELIEDAVANAATASVTSNDWDLTTTDGAANQARCALLIPTGTPGATRNINAPKKSKAYVVINQSNAAVVIRGGPTSPTTGVTIAAGVQSLVAWNGSDFVEVGQAGDVDGPATSTNNNIVLFNGTTGKIIKDGGQGLPSGTIVGTTDSQTLTNKTINGANNTISNINLASQVTGTLPVGNGGTGAATLTANNVLLGNGTSAVQVVAPGTNGNVLTSNGTTWQSTTPPAAYVGPNKEVFTANGTFTIPTGITKVKVTVVGGGGAGGRSLTTAGGAGGNSSISSGTQTITTVTANGGGGGAAGLNGAKVLGGDGGTASGGDLNIKGTAGGLGDGGPFSGMGGSSSFGGGARSVISSAAGNAGGAYGGGGSGGGNTTGCTTSAGGGGGGGATAIIWLSSLTPGNTLSVTVGSAGAVTGSAQQAGGAGAAGVVIFEW